MQYKKIDKIDPQFRKVGYALYNKENGMGAIWGEKEGLVIFSEVSKFGYQEGFTPSEISFEQIMLMMFKFDENCSFDSESLVVFLKYVKQDYPKQYEQLQLHKLEGLQLEEDKLITFGRFNTFNPELN